MSGHYVSHCGRCGGEFAVINRRRRGDLSGKISVSKLTEHPKNTYYFTDIVGEKYEEIKRSIEVNGIRDPLKVTTAYTIVSGHQRFRIASELGLSEVPVEIVDVNEWDAEYLLIAENVERRGQAESDPIKKARIAQFLKEYWGVAHGNNRYTKSGQNVQSKTTADIAETIGESPKQTQRLLKLNDLIPELQTLVSDGKLGTTAGEQLAFLSEEEQRALLAVKGDKIEKTTLTDAKDYREEARQAIAERESFSERLKQTEQRALEAERKLASAEIPKVVYEQVVKEVMPADKQRKLTEVQRENAELEAKYSRVYGRLQELERAQKATQQMTDSPLFDITRSASVLNNYLKTLAENPGFATDISSMADRETVNRLKAELSNSNKLIHEVVKYFNTTEVIIID